MSITCLYRGRLTNDELERRERMLLNERRERRLGADVRQIVLGSQGLTKAKRNVLIGRLVLEAFERIGDDQ